LSSSTFKNVQLGSVAFTLEGIRRIYDGLTRRVQEQCYIELSGLVKRADQTDEEFAGVKTELREQVFKVIVTVDFSDNSSKSESSRNVIDLEANGPQISRIYMSNVAPYKYRTGFEPEHRFGLLLDFSQPALLDAAARFLHRQKISQVLQSVVLGTAGWLVSRLRSRGKSLEDDRFERGFTGVSSTTSFR
jgi:hypothetical protein